LRFINSIISFLVYSNLFIASCAVVMANQTYHFLLHTYTNQYLLFFVLFSTICSYSFHWYLTTESVISSSRIIWLKQNRQLHLIFFFIGIVGTAIFFFYLIHYWFWLAIAAVVTFLYSAPKIPHKHFRALRKVALGKTIFLAFVWMYATTILPIIISPVKWQPHFILFILSRFFLIYAICILFDYRDREDDKAAGIRSLITYLNEKSILSLFIFSLIVFSISTLMMLQYDYELLDVLLIFFPGIIVALIYRYAIKNFSDIFYYLVLDGLMALSSIIMLVAGI